MVRCSPGRDLGLLPHAQSESRWAGSLQGLLPGAPTEPDLRLIKPPLSLCLIPDPGRMDIGDQDLKTDNLLHDDVCSADLLERESAMSFHSRRRSRPSAQTTHRPRGGTCRENPASYRPDAQLVHWHWKRAGQVRQPPLVAIELPGPDPPMGQLATRQEIPHRRARVALPGSWGVIPFPVELRRDGSSVFKCKTSRIGPSGPWPSGGCARSSSRSLATPDSSPGSIGPTDSSLTSVHRYAG